MESITAHLTFRPKIIPSRPKTKTSTILHFPNPAKLKLNRATRIQISNPHTTAKTPMSVAHLNFERNYKSGQVSPTLRKNSVLQKYTSSYIGGGVPPRRRAGSGVEATGSFCVGRGVS